MVYWGLDSEFF